METQKRGFGGLIFSSPVISATDSAPRAIDDLVVDLARQQPQRQADHAGGMRQHPLDREMGLAGVGRPEHGGDAGAGSPSIGDVDGEDEKAMFSEVSASLALGAMPQMMSRFSDRKHARVSWRSLEVFHNATLRRSRLKFWNESGTKSRPNR